MDEDREEEIEKEKEAGAKNKEQREWTGDAAEAEVLVHSTGNGPRHHGKCRSRSGGRTSAEAGIRNKSRSRRQHIARGTRHETRGARREAKEEREAEGRCEIWSSLKWKDEWSKVEGGGA